MKTANRELVDRLAAEYVLGTLRRPRTPALRALAVVAAGGGNRESLGRKARGPGTAARARHPACHGVARHRKTGWSCASCGAGRPRAGWPSPPRCFLRTRRHLPHAGSGAAQLSRSRRSAVDTTFDPGAGRAYLLARRDLLGDKQENNQVVAIHVDSAHPLEAGKALELWVLPAQGNPVSLGLLPVSGEARRALTDAQRAALAGAKQLAVSLEPAAARRPACRPVRCSMSPRSAPSETSPRNGVKPFSIRDLRPPAL